MPPTGSSPGNFRALTPVALLTSLVEAGHMALLIDPLMTRLMLLSIHSSEIYNLKAMSGATNNLTEFGTFCRSSTSLRESQMC